MPRRLHIFVLSATIASLAISAVSLAATQNFQLNFSSLPSAQGCNYNPVGSHAGTVESTVYSVAGGVLTQNSIGKGYGVSGGSIYYGALNGLVTTTETKQLRVTARCLQVEGSGAGAAGQQGFAFGFNTGSVQYDVSVTPTNIYALGPGGTINVAGTYNNTVFQEYVLDYAPPSTFRIYRGGVLIHTGTSGFAASGSRLFFGDGTGGANARAEITALRFVQNLVTPARATTWGRVKSLYR
jgi:hypothetical protein